MFKELKLLATYSTYDNNVNKEFYIPVISRAVSYKRATAYFSAKSLSSYMKGIEKALDLDFKYQLIIANEISADDFKEIKKGYSLKKEIQNSLIKSLKENITENENRNLSNLAYLISIGVLDLKIAFSEKGIFHDKFGILEDSLGNKISFRGSNNETYSAMNLNFESFDITCSWLSSDFDLYKIKKNINTFDELWNNKRKDVYTMSLDKDISLEINKFNKGNFINILPCFNDNDIYLTLENNILVAYYNKVNILGSILYKTKLKRHIENSDSNKIFFHNFYTYTNYKNLINLLDKNQNKLKYNLIVDSNLINFIDSRELYIQERERLGISIKQKSLDIQEEFQKYKEIVDIRMDRKLREKQMWDSFFMYSMKKCCNFSVPGSGKTSSVLGVFSFLDSLKKVNKILMIGPKNSFSSWIDEFRICFRGKKKLNIFNIQEFKTKNEKKDAILYKTKNKNLLLFNYESLQSVLNEVNTLIDGKTLLIFDEVHKVKSISGKRAAHALEIAKNANYVITLTGTPIPNSYLDIKNTLEILFPDEYEEQFGFDEKFLKNPDDEEIKEINKKLQPFYCRTTKKDLDVPIANKDIVINSYSNSFENNLFKIILSKYKKNKFALAIRLLQLQSNPRLLLGKLEADDFKNILDYTASEENIEYIDFSEDIKKVLEKSPKSQKYLKTLEQAEILYSQGKKIIIWCIFKDTIRQFKKDLNKKGISACTVFGETGNQERENNLKKYKNGEIDVLITNPHTLAESISLHHICHDAIYYEYSYNLVHLLQSKDRIHRLGLPNNQYTQYYYMQNKFTRSDDEFFSIDSQIYERLLKKEKIMLDAIENNVMEKVTTSKEDIELILGELITFYEKNHKI